MIISCLSPVGHARLNLADYTCGPVQTQCVADGARRRLRTPSLVLTVGQPVIVVGLLGAALGFFYTAPPLKLIARRGLGELTIGLCFGPLVTLGTVAALSGTLDMNAFWMGLPLGLLTTGILWINQFPDYESDKATGKNNLVVTLGVSASRFGYALIMLGAFAALVGLTLNGVFHSGVFNCSVGPSGCAPCCFPML